MIAYNQQLEYAKVFGETLFYGADCILMVAVLHIQLTSRHLQRTHKLMLAIADLMFLLTTAHISILLYEVFTGTVPPRILQSAVAVAQIELALGDLVLIWRVWVVWAHDIRIIILPALALLSGFAVGMTYAAEAVHYNNLSKILPAPTVILSLINTALCTALIAGRLAYLDHLINGHLAFGAGRDHTYMGVIMMIMESGAVLTFANAISLTLERLQHPGLHVMLNIQIPLSNIVPTSIIVLSHLKLNPGDTIHETVTVRFATHAEDSVAFPHRQRSSRRGHELTTTRSGTSLEFSPDVEKQCPSISLGAVTVTSATIEETESLSRLSFRNQDT